MKEKILVDGIWSYEIPDTAPDFVLGKQAFNLSKFSKFMAENAKYAVNGFLTIQILRAKSGKRYAVLDTYDYEKRQNSGSEAQNSPVTNEKPAPDPRFQFTKKDEDLPIIDRTEEVNVEDIPF